MNRRTFLQLSVAATAAAVFPACLNGAPKPSSGLKSKRGLGISAKKGSQWREKLKACGACWFYSWNRTPPENIPAGVEFVPMVWRGKPGDTFTKLGEQLRKAGCQQLLGLNEPDQKKQSNVTVEDALALWPNLMDTGLRLGSPGCVHPDREWMKKFMAGVKERGLRVDFVCVHSYGGPSAEALVRRLEKIHQMFERPLWITEFAVGDWEAKSVEENKHKPETVLGFMEKVLPMLDQLDFVERYAWFPAKPTSIPLGTSALFDAEGALTPLGECYRDA